jgi:repressor LexA
MQYKKPEYCAMIEDYINSYRNRQGSAPSVRQIASGVGLAVGTVSKYLSYMRENGVLDYDGHRSVTTRKTRGFMNMLYVPLLGAVSCGVPKFAEENIEEYVCLPESLFGKGDFFLLRARGDSMTGAGIEDGDLVLIRQQSTAEYNQIVVALVDDEATLKRFRPRENGVCLHPENNRYEDIIVGSCVIQGVAVKVIKDLN